MKLFDCRGLTPIDLGPIHTQHRLLAILMEHARQRPHFLKFEHTNGSHLLIGIGGPFATVQFTDKTAKPPYLVAKSISFTALQPVEFLMGDTPTPVPSELIIPLEAATDIVSEFHRNGTLIDSVHWREI